MTPVSKMCEKRLRACRQRKAIVWIDPHRALSLPSLVAAFAAVILLEPPAEVTGVITSSEPIPGVCQGGSGLRAAPAANPLHGGNIPAPYRPHALKLKGCDRPYVPGWM